VRPGADLPVALAIAHALFDRGLADRAFLDRHANGVEEFARRANAWSIDAAAREAGIEPQLIDGFVELYASSSPAVIRPGWGLERNRNGGSAVAAILALPAIAGKLGVRGGGFTMQNSDANWTVTVEDGIGEEPSVARVVNMSDIARTLAELRDPRVECLFVYNCNPVLNAPDQRALVEQLARDDLFVVVHEQVMTDTANLADVVLPATTFLEHRELRRGYGHMRMFDAPPVIAPVGEARSNNQLFGALLDRLGLARAGEPRTDDELIAHLFARSPRGGELRDALAKTGVASPPDGATPIPFVDAFPGTPDRKIHLVPAALDRDALGGLYAYKPDPATTAYPLALISPALATQITSTFGQLRTAPAVLELSPDDARARGIATGDRVRAWNDRGEVRCFAQVSADVRPGVCVLPKGLWRKHSRNGFTANALIPAGFADLGGQAAFNDARVQVARDEAG
jgi:anaerobic selenocysteine-containing dehydrogenase